jgi:hypothetical protein
MALAYFSNSFSRFASKLSSQPTSTRTLMPPSSSNSESDAAEVDLAPRSDVKLNMRLASAWQYAQ